MASWQDRVNPNEYDHLHVLVRKPAQFEKNSVKFVGGCSHTLSDWTHVKSGNISQKRMFHEGLVNQYLLGIISSMHISHIYIPKYFG